MSTRAAQRRTPYRIWNRNRIRNGNLCVVSWWQAARLVSLGTEITNIRSPRAPPRPVRSATMCRVVFPDYSRFLAASRPGHGAASRAGARRCALCHHQRPQRAPTATDTRLCVATTCTSMCTRGDLRVSRPTKSRPRVTRNNGILQRPFCSMHPKANKNMRLSALRYTVSRA